MANRILLNNNEFHINRSDLPCLITYREKSGGSQLSISLIADMFLRGEKILFITAFPPGKENFLAQIKGSEEKTSYITSIDQLDASVQAIILESGNGKLLLGAINTLPDIDNRIIFIKNIETFENDVFKTILGNKKMILSGDIDACVDKELITNNNFASIIAFSQPETPIPAVVPPLEKYVGFFHCRNKEGLIRVEMLP